VTSLMVSSIPLNITLERAVARDVLRALLHSILFHRLFGTVHPRCVDVLDVTFPGVSDAEIERLVNDKVELFWRALDDLSASSSSPKRGQLIVTLSERRPKKTWFSMGEEEIAWEIWTINASIYSPQSERDRRAILDPLPDTLSNLLLTILNHTSSEKGRACVPPIVTAGVVSPFPLHIGVKVAGVEIGAPE